MFHNFLSLYPSNPAECCNSTTNPPETPPLLHAARTAAQDTTTQFAKATAAAAAAAASAKIGNFSEFLGEIQIHRNSSNSSPNSSP